MIMIFYANVCEYIIIVLQLLAASIFILYMNLNLVVAGHGPDYK